MEKWRKKLQLDGWTIICQMVDQVTLRHAACLALADIHWDPKTGSRSAIILFSIKDQQEDMNLESLVKHELLHLKLFPLSHQWTEDEEEALIDTLVPLLR